MVASHQAHSTFTFLTPLSPTKHTQHLEPAVSSFTRSFAFILIDSFNFNGSSSESSGEDAA